MEPEATPFTHEFTVDTSAIDENGHVNNVVYIQWMQDTAILHSERCGGTAATHALDCSWVIRSHRIDYLHPAFAGDTIIAQTWVVDIRKVRSLRRYIFKRKEDEQIIARGETDWVYVNAADGRPRKIPESVARCYPLLPDYK